MSDARSAPESDPGTIAPVLEDRLLVDAEIDVVREDVADPSEPQPRNAL